jgi:hypothetical protein
MVNKKVKSGRGGKRPGAGRPLGSTYPEEKRRKPVNIRLPVWLADWLKNHPESSGRLIERALKMTYNLKPKRGRK